MKIGAAFQSISSGLVLISEAVYDDHIDPAIFAKTFELGSGSAYQMLSGQQVMHRYISRTLCVLAIQHFRHYYLLL